MDRTYLNKLKTSPIKSQKLNARWKYVTYKYKSGKIKPRENMEGQRRIHASSFFLYDSNGLARWHTIYRPVEQILPDEDSRGPKQCL